MRCSPRISASGWHSPVERGSNSRISGWNALTTSPQEQTNEVMIKPTDRKLLSDLRLSLIKINRLLADPFGFQYGVGGNEKDRLAGFRLTRSTPVRGEFGQIVVATRDSNHRRI